MTFTDGGQPLGTATLNASGVGTFSTTALSVGTHAIVATYSGNTDNTASHSPVLTQVVLAQTTTSLSAAPTTTTASMTVLLSAQVTSNGGTHPSGTITFKDGATTIGIATLNPAGAATLQIATLASGSHSLTAVYSGDTLDTPSTSPNVIETVQAIPDTGAACGVGTHGEHVRSR